MRRIGAIKTDGLPAGSRFPLWAPLNEFKTSLLNSLSLSGERGYKIKEKYLNLKLELKINYF
ncbi:MAG: hypothetical protein Q8S84_06400 [bacterium]|nr:hypothetical protein [bacterium]